MSLRCFNVSKTDILQMLVHSRCFPDQEIFNRHLTDVRVLSDRPNRMHSIKINIIIEHISYNGRKSGRFIRINLNETEASVIIKTEDMSNFICPGLEVCTLSCFHQVITAVETEKRQLSHIIWLLLFHVC